MDLNIPVLLVDDRQENLTALEALLEDMPLPLHLVKAMSGHEALRQSLRHDFAVVLLDVQMPEMDGLETAELLRTNPRTRHLPIIFVTAGLHDRVRQFKGYEMGAVDFLNKPIEPAVLRNKVAVLCELYAKVQERTQALHESERRLRMVIDSACEAFIATDSQDIVTDWNHAAEDLFGWRRDEMLGQPAGKVLLPPAGCSQRGRHRTGREFDVEVSQWQVPQSQPPAFAALVRDITQRKEAEEARSCELRQALQQIVEQEKMVALGSIVAGVAHELNTPVGNLVLLASTLRDRVGELAGNALAGKLTRSCLVQAAGECREASEVLIRSADRARELIESFKNVAVDQTSQRRRQFDLQTCLHDILVTLGRMMRQANVTAELQVPPGVLMDSYPGHLEQILNNLIVNSILHGFEGRGCGKVSIAASVAGDHVRLVYSDDGVGIAPELQQKIFEPFFSTKVGAGGSGLGMYIVNNLVSGALQGSVSLSSAPGQGVRFEFSLPLAPA
ncbi:PAS domain S-box-containing protein [Duganella sp. CF458]|uniref:sensor histidine kinase n=1 Tax=Duganella sp. CF458 TaxID=1884368 RepID=UPI0008EC8F0C|nr:ATP-binding protein [Duganella sp. CF458]SFG95898.1 PAS domain S-box-containing protein [Duganella sp. CF458]